MELYPRICALIEQAWQDGYHITALRMNENTRRLLPRAVLHKTTQVTALNTPYGRVLIKDDPGLPDATFMTQVDVPPLHNRAMLRVYLEDDELHAE